MGEILEVTSQHARRLLEDNALALPTCRQRDGVANLIAWADPQKWSAAELQRRESPPACPLAPSSSISIHFGGAEVPADSPLLPPPATNAGGESSRRPYRWMPTQTRQHAFSEERYFLGTYVNSLSLRVGGHNQWHTMAV